jgi:hypothetical protein
MTTDKLPSVTAIQLHELRRIRDDAAPGVIYWPNKTTKELRKKELIETVYYGKYKVTALGFDVLKKNERRAGRLPRKIL